jgi:hypothetical protein
MEVTHYLFAEFSGRRSLAVVVEAALAQLVVVVKLADLDLLHLVVPPANKVPIFKCLQKRVVF